MKKKIQTPFSIKKLKDGGKVETYLGEEVRILCEDAGDKAPIVGLINNNVFRWNEQGKLLVEEQPTDRDLVIVEEIDDLQWVNIEDAVIDGWFVNSNSELCACKGRRNTPDNHNVFFTMAQAKSVLAMARISQIIANDSRYGGVVTDKEWNSNTWKYVIYRNRNNIECDCVGGYYCFLAFHTRPQRDLFLQENEQLIKDYFMITDDESNN